MLIILARTLCQHTSLGIGWFVMGRFSARLFRVVLLRFPTCLKLSSSGTGCVFLYSMNYLCKSVFSSRCTGLASILGL